MSKRIGIIVGVVVVVVAAILMFRQTGTEEAYVIGCITPLTGNGATYGDATKKGAGLAISEINAAGGVGGRDLRIQYEDSKIEPKEGVNAAQKLISVDRVPVILGAFGSSVTLAVAPIAQRNKVVLLSASSTADSIKDAGEHVFRNVPPNKGQGTTAARFALSHLDAKNASVLRMNNDYGLSLAEAFAEAYEADGGAILSTESYNEDHTDFRTQLAKIKAEGPDVVFFPGHYKQSAPILRQAKELGLNATFIGGDGSYSPQLTSVAGNAAEGSYYTVMAIDSPESNEKVASYQAAFKERYGQESDVYAAYAYDAVMTIAEAIRQGGYAAAGIKEALQQLSWQGVTGTTKFDEFGEVDKPFGVYVVKDGRFILVSWR